MFVAGVNRVQSFAITDTNLYLPIETLSTHGNIELLDQLKSGLKRTVNWNKYQWTVKIQQQNPYLDYLINPSFQGVNRLFVLSLLNNMVRTKYKECQLQKWIITFLWSMDKTYFE